MKTKKMSLGMLLDNDEISGVDALLRRLNDLLAQAEHLDSKEKQEVSEGHKALSKLFYSGAGRGKFPFTHDSEVSHSVVIGKIRNGMSFRGLIRPECLQPAEVWEQPSGDEVREVLRLSGFTGSQAAKKLGLKNRGDRTIRRWTGEETPIPYTAWALLCDYAGLGQIWKN